MKDFPCLLLVFDTFTVLLCVQSLFDISNDIIRIFDTYRQTNQVRAYPCFHKLFVRQLAVSMACRVKHTATCICYVSDDSYEFQ